MLYLSFKTINTQGEWHCVGKSAAADGYEITFVVDEPRRVTGGVTTLFGTNEGSLVTDVIVVVLEG